MIYKLFTRFKFFKFCLHVLVIFALIKMDITSTDTKESSKESTTVDGKQLCEELQHPEESDNQKVHSIGLLDDKVMLLTTKCNIYSLTRDYLQLSADKASLKIDTSPVATIESFNCSPSNEDLFYWIKDGNEKPTSYAALMVIVASKIKQAISFRRVYQVIGSKIKKPPEIKNSNGTIKLDYVVNVDDQTTEDPFSGYAKVVHIQDPKKHVYKYRLYADKYEAYDDDSTVPYETVDSLILSITHIRNESFLAYIYILQDGNIWYSTNEKSTPFSLKNFIECNFSNEEDTEGYKPPDLFDLLVIIGIVVGVSLILLLIIVIYCKFYRVSKSEFKKSNEDEESTSAHKKGKKTPKKDKKKIKVLPEPLQDPALLPSGSVCSATKGSVFDKNKKKPRTVNKKVTEKGKSPKTSLMDGTKSTPSDKTSPNSKSKDSTTPQNTSKPSSEKIKSKGPATSSTPISSPRSKPSSEKIKSKGPATSSTPTSSPRSKQAPSPASPKSPSH